MNRLTIKTLAVTGLVLAVSVGVANANTGYAPLYNDVVHDALSGTVVHNTWGNCVLTKWLAGRNNCNGAPISEEARTVYFAFNSSVLTEEYRKRLDTLAGTLKANGIEEVQVVGYADRIGNPVYNEKLSKKRAEVVRHYLVSRGIASAGEVKTRWFGESEPATSCPAGMKRKELIACLQPDRRVEVEIVYK